MNLLETWVQTPVASALGWTLAHSLWEGAIVALTLAVALCFQRSSRARYAAGCLAMLGLLGALGFTFTRMMPRQRIQLIPLAEVRGAAPAASAASQQAANHRVERGVADYLPWLAPFWIAGVLVFHLRGVISSIAARRLRRIGVCCAPDLWQARLDRLRARLRLSRPIALLESCLAETPVVIGYIRPVILMPVGLLAGLPAGQIEAILLHELAHIRRHDYLVNLLQVFVEGLLFYHPATWWISGVIRAERENCCDDLTVAVTGAAYEYATALAALEQNRRVPSQALAATGGSLVNRIRRLLAQPERPAAALTPVFTAAILTIAAVTAMAAWQSQAPQAIPLTPYAKWLHEDVAYIVTEDERQAWTRLATDEEREKFIEQFWLRRGNEFKEEHYRRIAHANDRFRTTGIAGWKTDRGRIYIVHGPPDQIESHPFGSASDYPFEDWRYHHIDGRGDNVDFEFVDKTWSGNYLLTANLSDKRAPQGNPITGPLGRIGATVQVQNETPDAWGGARISIPMSGYADHHMKLLCRVVTAEGRGAASFEDGVEGPTPLYTRFVQTSPGSYHLKIVVKDVTTGAVGEENVEFEVK